MRINIGITTEHEMVMRAKQHQISICFSVLIIELCRWTQVPRDVKKDLEVMPISYTNIQRIGVEYLKDELEKNKKSHVDSSPVSDTYTSPPEVLLPTLTPGLSGTSSVIPFDIPSSYTNTLPL